MSEVFKKFAFKYRSYLLLLGIGLGAGFMGGLLGIGGGTVIVPCFIFFLAFNQKRAHGTSLVVALCIALAGVAMYATHGKINWWMAIAMTIGGVFGATIGAKVSAKLRSKTLRKIFAYFLFLVAVYMVYKTFHKIPSSAGHGMDAFELTKALVIFATGIVTGFMSALLGIGGGLVMIPALSIFLGVEQVIAQGISLAAMIPTAFTGILMHNKLGNVDFRVGRWVGFGAMIGSVLGSFLAIGPAEKYLKAIFAVFLIIIGILMTRKKD